MVTPAGFHSSHGTGIDDPRFKKTLAVEDPQAALQREKQWLEEMGLTPGATREQIERCIRDGIDRGDTHPMSSTNIGLAVDYFLKILNGTATPKDSAAINAAFAKDAKPEPKDTI